MKAAARLSFPASAFASTSTFRSPLSPAVAARRAFANAAIAPSLASSSSSPPTSSSSFNASFPCVDAHELRTERLERAARESGRRIARAREPLRTNFPEREECEDPKGEEPSYTVSELSV